MPEINQHAESCPAYIRRIVLSGMTYSDIEQSEIEGKPFVTWDNGKVTRVADLPEYGGDLYGGIRITFFITNPSAQDYHGKVTISIGRPDVGAESEIIQTSVFVPAGTKDPGKQFNEWWRSAQIPSAGEYDFYVELKTITV